MHSSLAVTTSGLPLGLTAVKFWTRKKFKGTNALKRKINPTRVPIEEKESYRWLENLRQSTALLYWSTSADGHQFPVIVVADSLPATAFQQRIQPVSPAANSGRHRHNLRPVIIKTDIQRAFKQTDAVYQRRWLNLTSTAPLTVAEDVIHPVVLLRQLQHVGQTKKIVLLRQFAGAAAPEIIQLMTQSCTNAERPALVE